MSRKKKNAEAEVESSEVESSSVEMEEEVVEALPPPADEAQLVKQAPNVESDVQQNYRCGVCGQLSGACGDRHNKVALTADVHINGVKYRGGGDVWVPADSFHTWKSAISKVIA